MNWFFPFHSLSAMCAVNKHFTAYNWLHSALQLVIVHAHFWGLRYPEFWQFSERCVYKQSGIRNNWVKTSLTTSKPQKGSHEQCERQPKREANNKTLLQHRTTPKKSQKLKSSENWWLFKRNQQNFILSVVFFAALDDGTHSCYPENGFFPL